MVTSDMFSFSFVAIDVKYLLKALAIILLSVTRFLSMMKDGFKVFFDFPLRPFIIAQVFLRSSLQSENLLVR